jgi:N-methylhydantoinase A
MSSAQASSRAGETLISGPAAGVLAGVAFSPSDTFITADMGGTSFDVALVEGGRPRITLEGEVAGFNVRLPRIDVNTIGAGGGSIAWIDAGGALRVGPRSSGAVPGPACYRRGGDQPTVTDAHAVLGRINPGYMLGGEMKIDVSASRTVVDRDIAQPLGLSVEEAAQGILDVVNATMVKGIRKVSVERGHDPGEFDLISFGGAGPLHAIELAAELGMKRVVIPYHPGVNSALGLLAADYRYTKLRSLLVPFAAERTAEINQALEELRAQAQQELGSEGFSGDRIQFEHHLYLRYAGQGSELEIPLESGTLSADTVHERLELFGQKHVQEFGYKRETEPVELVNLRVTAITEGGIRSLAGHALQNQHASAESSREVIISGVRYECRIYEREHLPAGSRMQGPAVIEQLDSTTVVPPGYTVEVDSQLNLLARSDSNE